ncbi:MAG: hypothetical protein JSU04_19210 [Bdellovibrionales bacterium]|nr:hypothetical protein [Bdellovibrionales bacterium]
MKTKSLTNRRGQVVVEYVLLLVIAVAVAALITKELVRRDPDSPGVLIKKWDDILKEIGSDLPDKSN